MKFEWCSFRTSALRLGGNEHFPFSRNVVCVGVGTVENCIAMTFSFSVTRLLEAMGVCAVALALTNDLGDYRVLGAVCVGVPIALLVLFAGKRDLLPMARTFLWCGSGACIGMLP